MQPKYYEIIRRAVEDGVGHGWHKAHKHSDNPESIVACDIIVHDIMAELSEYFNFEINETE